MQGVIRRCRQPLDLHVTQQARERRLERIMILPVAEIADEVLADFPRSVDSHVIFRANDLGFLVAVFQGLRHLGCSFFYATLSRTQRSIREALFAEERLAASPTYQTQVAVIHGAQNGAQWEN